MDIDSFFKEAQDLRNWLRYPLHVGAMPCPYENGVLKQEIRKLWVCYKI
jgi:hypothetical protein